MASDRNDFFLSRRGSVATVAREVADVLAERGYKVLVQDYDIPYGASFVEAMHEAVKNSRDLIILFTGDYESSPYTRKEFTSFEGELAQDRDKRRIVVLRCEDVPLRGLLADCVYQDLVGVADPDERKQRILAAAEGRSQAQRPPPRAFLGVPPRLTTFTGRAESLDRLDSILLADKPAAVVQAAGRAAVQGLGGVGKTSLAAEYAYRFGNLYAGVCWCPAETPTSLLKALATLAVELGATVTGDDNLETAAKAALRRLAEQRATWLLIYDNVTSPDEIKDLLPLGGARVLITSRFSDWGNFASKVSLDVMSADEAVDFLERRTGKKDESGARKLGETLGYLPLALDHAAAYCEQSDNTFAMYAAKVEKVMDTELEGLGYPRTVAATFRIALDQAVARCASAERLIVYLSCCAPERIPMALVEGAIGDDIERDAAVRALVRVSLVKRDPFEDGTRSLTMHRLVQSVARSRPTLSAEILSALAKQIERGLEDPRFEHERARFLPHAVSFLYFLQAEEFRDSDAGELYETLAQRVILALFDLGPKDISPEHLAGLLREYYEDGPLFRAISEFRQRNPEAWAQIEHPLINENNFVLRHAMSHALADSYVNNASLLADTVARSERAARRVRDLPEFEFAGYALALIFIREPRLIERPFVERLSKYPIYPGQQLLGDLLLNLVFQTTNADLLSWDRWRDTRGMATGDRFWHSRWGFIRLHVSEILAAEAFIAGGAVADSSAEVQQCYRNLHDIKIRLENAKGLARSKGVQDLLARYFSLGREPAAVEKVREDLRSDPNRRELFWLLLAHPIWYVAEESASILASLAKEDDEFLQMISDFWDEANWRVQYGANEAAFGANTAFPDLFKKSVRQFFDHPNGRIRALCTENFVSGLLTAGGTKRERLVRDFESEIRFWLNNTDCATLEHIYRLFAALHKKGIDFKKEPYAGLLQGPKSPLMGDLPAAWYSLDRSEFLQHIERRKEA